MKQINACWLRRIKELREMINETEALRNKKSDLFLKLVSLTKELDGPMMQEHRPHQASQRMSGRQLDNASTNFETP
jgi:hypothetical protein